jgi:hypothetical protein
MLGGNADGGQTGFRLGPIARKAAQLGDTDG